MGKSLGNTIEPKELVHKFGPDAVRYFFLREVEFGNDGDYSEDRFINIVNAHLANTIGMFQLLLLAFKPSIRISYHFIFCILYTRYLYDLDLTTLQEIFSTVLLDFLRRTAS